MALKRSIVWCILVICVSYNCAVKVVTMDEKIRGYDDDLNWGRPMPNWPDGFADRLEVIKFNYSKNVKTGMAVIGGNNGFEL